MARDVSAIAVYHPLALQLKAVIVSSVAFCAQLNIQVYLVQLTIICIQYSIVSYYKEIDYLAVVVMADCRR